MSGPQRILDCSRVSWRMKLQSSSLLLSKKHDHQVQNEVVAEKESPGRLIHRFVRSRMVALQWYRERCISFDQQSPNILNALKMDIPLKILVIVPILRLGLSLFPKRVGTIEHALKIRLVAMVTIVRLQLMQSSYNGVHDICQLDERDVYLRMFDRLIEITLYKLHIWHQRLPEFWQKREPLVDFLLSLICHLEETSVCSTAAAAEDDITDVRTSTRRCMGPALRRILFLRIYESRLFIIAGQQIGTLLASHSSDNSPIDSAEAAYASKLFRACLYMLIYSQSDNVEATCYESYISLLRHVVMICPDMITRMGNLVTPILEEFQRKSTHLSINWNIIGTILRQYFVCDETHRNVYLLKFVSIPENNSRFERHIYSALFENPNLSITQTQALIGAINCYSIAIQSEFIMCCGGIEVDSDSSMEDVLASDAFNGRDDATKASFTTTTTSLLPSSLSSSSSSSVSSIRMLNHENTTAMATTKTAATTFYGKYSDVLRLIKCFSGRAWCYCEQRRYHLAQGDIERYI